MARILRALPSAPQAHFSRRGHFHTRLHGGHRARDWMGGRSSARSAAGYETECNRSASLPNRVHQRGRGATRNTVSFSRPEVLIERGGLWSGRVARVWHACDKHAFLRPQQPRPIDGRPLGSRVIKKRGPVGPRFPRAIPEKEEKLSTSLSRSPRSARRTAGQRPCRSQRSVRCYRCSYPSTASRSRTARGRQS